MKRKVTFKLGQMVYWPAAPRQIAQVVELRRKKVRLFYVCRSGCCRQPIVNAFALDLVQSTKDLLLPLHNPYGRGIAVTRQKTFSV